MPRVQCYMQYHGADAVQMEKQVKCFLTSRHQPLDAPTFYQRNSAVSNPQEGNATHPGHGGNTAGRDVALSVVELLRIPVLDVKQRNGACSTSGTRTAATRAHDTRAPQASGKPSPGGYRPYTLPRLFIVRVAILPRFRRDLAIYSGCDSSIKPTVYPSPTWH